LRVYKASEKLIEMEKQIKRYWDKHQIPQKVLRLRGEKKFYFLDGPPYVTERSHVGTAWNKVLKDTILRYKRMKGYWVWSIPGYDTHGLPIEVMVERKLNIRDKKEILKIGVAKFNEECFKLAKRNMDILTEQFRNLGVWMDWQNPYATFTKDYISNVWWIIKKGHEQGLLEEDLRVFHWCPRCETVLSEHEVSMGYKDVEGPSIYVKFPMKDDSGYLLIWTTTPWTLPSNVAVAVHPDLYYVKIRLKESGDELILVENRLDEVIKDEYDIISKFEGSELEGKRYINPLDKYVNAQREIDAHFVVLSTEYVSPDEGTGLVHIAPEHGKEDFEISKEYRLPIITLVDNEGKYIESAGKYYGKYVFDADDEIINDLQNMGVLYHKETVVHRYPHCWRCRTPLIMKTTKQWILKLSTLKEKLLSENETIKWIPDWAGSQRFRSWLETARDWVITRQRYWGTPAPIWKCKDCGDITVIGSYKEIEDRGFKLDDLHKPYIDNIKWKCKKCNGVVERIPDVLDVWIDSGAASWASIGYPENIDMFKKLWPIDFITEGHDQTRGWFYSLLCLGIIGFDKTPYSSVLVHGFTLDERGIGMSKSLGNVIYPEEITDIYGVDAFRVFVLSHTVWEDMIVNVEKTKDVVRNLNIILNVYDFYNTYASIDNYRWRGKLDSSVLMEEDLWIISALERLIDDVGNMMDKYQVHSALRSIIKFLVEEISRKYIKLVRRRVWIEEDNDEKISVYDTLHYVLSRIAVLMAPFMPHLSEYLYLHKLSMFEDKKYESVHLIRWPYAAHKFINEALIQKYRLMWSLIAAANSIRQTRKIKIRQPLGTLYIPKKLYKQLTSRILKLMSEQANVHKIVSYKDSEKQIFIKYMLKPRLDIIGKVFRKDMEKVLEAVERLREEEIEELYSNKSISIKIEGDSIVLEPEYFEITITGKENYGIIDLDGNLIALDVEITRDLLYEGLAKEIVRRIQFMRKEMNLDILDNILIYIETDAEEITNAINKEKEYILYETRGLDISIGKPVEKSYVKQWKIDKHDVTIGIIKR